VLPDLFPQGRLTSVEAGVWNLYADELMQQTKGK